MESGSESLSEEQLEFLGYVRSSGKHLLEMVNDILDLSKIKAGKIEIEEKHLGIKGVLSSMQAVIQFQANRKQIAIEMNLASDLGIIQADEVRIKQVLYNLLSNAIKFTGERKRIGYRCFYAG